MFRPLLSLLLLLLACACPEADAVESANPAPAPHLSGGFGRAQQPWLSETGLEAARHSSLWDSLQGDPSRHGRAVLGPFSTEDNLELYLNGFPGESGLRLTLVRESDGTELELRPRSSPGPEWVRLRWCLPSSWQGVRVRLQAVDESSSPGGWLGFSAPLPGSSHTGTALALLGRQGLACLLLLLPGLALTVCLPEGKNNYPLITVLAGSALAAYLLFFITFGNTDSGLIAGWLLLLGSTLALLLRRKELWQALQDAGFSLPLLLSLLAALQAVLALFLYGGTESPMGIPVNRCLVGMTSDHWLPYEHAKLLIQGAPLRPFVLDWLTSDRPPLQTGLTLLARPLLAGELGYVCVGIAAQSWVWVGLWVCLRGLGAQPRSAALVVAGALFSGFFFFNTVFVWPKLLPAAFLLCVAALLWDRERDAPIPLSSASLAGACAALAFLGHGGSFFGLAGLIASYLLQRRRLNTALMLAPALTALCLLAPWFTYQKVYDPPGDRLIKYHLADRQELDPRPVSTVLLEAYGRTPVSELLSNRLGNLGCQFLGRADWTSNTAKSLALWREGRSAEALTLFGHASRIAGFYHHAQALGPLLFALPGLVLLLRRHRQSPDARAARHLLLFLGTTMAFWILLMFARHTAVIHAGSYFSGACLFAVAGLGLAALPKPAIAAILSLNTGFFLLVWLCAQPRSSPNDPSPHLLPAALPGLVLVWALVTVALLLCLPLLARTAQAGHRPRDPR